MSSLARYKDAWLELDRFWARRLHHAVACAPLLKLFVGISVIGDGAIWVVVAGAVWLFGGAEGERCVHTMLALGAANLVIYLALKHSTGRARPYLECPDILACTRALDRYSFPSGHTLHAVAFAVLIPVYFPPLAPLLWGFALLVALSRIVLGLHYPSDVLAAVAIGLATGGAFTIALLHRQA